MRLCIGIDHGSHIAYVDQDGIEIAARVTQIWNDQGMIDLEFTDEHGELLTRTSVCHTSQVPDATVSYWAYGHDHNTEYVRETAIRNPLHPRPA